jgi:hypothetical protein
MFFLCTILGVAAAAPICSEVTHTAGGGPPNSDNPSLISAGAIKQIQLAQYLENLEVSFFSTGLANITEWGGNNFPNNAMEVIRKISAVGNHYYDLYMFLTLDIARGDIFTKLNGNARIL